jgi:hypothetical protein
MSIDDNLGNIKAKVKDSRGKKVKNIETLPLEKQTKIDKDKLLKEIKKISKEEEEFNAERIMDNIVNIDDKNNDVKLPKKKK